MTHGNLMKADALGTDREGNWRGLWASGMTASERFWLRVNKTESCWLWTGPLNRAGYGRFAPVGRKRVQVHRYAYEEIVGAIPLGLQLDHRCRVRHCVRPSHLEPVTSRENTLRGETVTARAAKTTHCPQGHEYTPENTYLRQLKTTNGPDRMCRACNRERLRQRSAASRRATFGGWS